VKQFYSRLPILTDFSAVTQPERFAPLPADWHVATCDVRNTDRAHMTCLVFNHAGKHLHFIDGADGGLFLAAKAFKERAAKLD